MPAAFAILPFWSISAVIISNGILFELINVEKQRDNPLKFSMSVLKKIVDQKKIRVAAAKSKTPLPELRSAVRDMDRPRDFRKAIRRDSGPIRLIAEIKKASPSRGLIKADFDHKLITGIYERKNVDAISVLTEEDFFQGSLDFLKDVKGATSRPVLRKDFIFDEYQIYETRAKNADAFLLMAAILEKNQAREFLNLAEELGLSVLFEIHDIRELETALEIKAPVIGINNRDLKTLRIDLNNTFELKKEIPDDRIVVSESGIKTREDVLKLWEAGIDAMLVGTSLMTSDDIGAKIDQLLGR